MEGKPIPKVSTFEILKSLRALIKNPITVISANIKKYGSIYYTKTFFGDTYVVTDPEIIQHILQKNHKNYYKSDAQKKLLADQIGNGLLTSDGPYWLKQRRLIQPGFHRERLVKLFEIMKEETLLFFSNKKKYEQPVSLNQLMMQLTFKVVSKSLFSEGITDQELDRIGFVIKELQEYITQQARQPYLNTWLKITGKKKYYRQLLEEADAIMFRTFEERKASQASYDDLLQMLMDIRYEDTEEGMTKQQLRDEAVILFVAGHETSANALTWAFHLLTQHPQIAKKLKAEVEEVLGDRPIEFNDLAKLTYTRQVIDETMRLYPPAWVIDRKALQDDAINGYHIPANSNVFLYIYGVHHDAKWWADPETFDPDRFEKTKVKERKKFTYFPFGGGPRLCIGFQFALMEMQIILAEAFRTFDIETLVKEEVELKPMVTLGPRIEIPTHWKIKNSP